MKDDHIQDVGILFCLLCIFGAGGGAGYGVTRVFSDTDIPGAIQGLTRETSPVLATEAARIVQYQPFSQYETGTTRVTLYQATWVERVRTGERWIFSGYMGEVGETVQIDFEKAVGHPVAGKPARGYERIQIGTYKDIPGTDRTH